MTRPISSGAPAARPRAPARQGAHPSVSRPFPNPPGGPQAGGSAPLRILLPALAVALCAALLAPAAQAEPRFEDRSATIPEHVYTGDWEHFVGGGAAVFDCNGDALPEIVAAGGTSPMLLLRNEGGFAFTPAPFPEITDSTGAYPLDVNGDGALDLFVLRVGTDRLLLGDGACGFTEATGQYAIPQEDRWSTAFTAWWEGDGAPTLAIGHYVDRTDPSGPFEACDGNVILRPSPSGYVSEPLEPGFCALSILAARDARGRLGLRLSNDRHYYVRGGYEQMWDIAEGRFLTEEDGWPTVSLWGMGIASRDLDGDGRDEVMLTSMGDQLLQLAGPDGAYRAAPFSIGTYAQRPYLGDDGRPSTGWHAEWGDVDNDGRDDLFIAKGNVDQMPTNAIHDPNNLLMQGADGTFAEAGLAAGIATTDRSRGAALSDLDGDGRLDLVVINRRAPMELYRNVTESTGHWLALDLSQSGGNSRAIGAQIVVETADGQRHTRQLTIGGGHAGGEAGPLHFGLGAAEAARVSVTWPDGTVTTAEAPADRPLRLQHP
ncbi:CRTAC1 family protein [Pseudoroseicyclus tamaricis]|uniref:CRTAC1 family protein n=1 Tax=Pseudoroseicyclus tamaricis TaxID=2705421 RepID=A0A6B2K0S6_9RHOB|nr:CRTAC1 family protein [Pseudoroseicyclus tamaricis]NDV01292.1 CRTAC1 family protein [Pseudoroseicyclus tamaricis]